MMPLQRLFFLLVLLTFSIISCRKKDDPEPSPAFITMEAEGGSESVKLGSGDWSITGVVNQNGGQRIFGNAYTIDGQKTKENKPLELEGPGRLETTGFDKGFSIVYDQEEINLTLFENSTDDVYSFKIVLSKGDETKEIIVEQKISQGYTFHDITYTLGEGDGDSLYTREGTHYNFNLITPQQVSIDPFGGVDVLRTAYFESDNEFALKIRKDSIKVPVPVEIRDGEMVFSELRDVYGIITRDPYTPGADAFVDVPAGGAHFWSKQEWHSRRISYTLTVRNNRTGELKEIEGKWREQARTGHYEIVKDFD